MSNSDHRTAFEALDFGRLLDHLSAQAQTRRGAQSAIVPSLANSLSAVRQRYTEVQELLELEELGFEPPLGGIQDVSQALEAAAKGSVLEIEALLEVRSSVFGFHRLDEWLSQHAQICPVLTERSLGLHLDPTIRQFLSQAFNDQGELSEARYPRLKELREQLESLERSIRNVLDNLVKGQSLEHLLQDRYATVRGERWVLPIRASAKRSGLGIVHDTSRSGETVFIEPKEVVELNNRSKIVEGELAREEERILTELSRLVGGAAPSLLAALDTSVHVDLAAARCRLGKQFQGTIPEVDTQGVIEIKSARHPLLALSENPAVPNDLFLSTEHPALVISGPNAGGKTVAMKTLGLCALMVRSAIPLPAAPGSRVDLFDPICTVLGDDQGIESGLSTFSAHILAIQEVLSSSGNQSLVLLDELASGTDPIQGAALARAVLEQLVDTGARVVATTHFPELKHLGQTDSRFRSAAMQFENQAPTYKVEVGQEGHSHAFAIARRFGLPEQILHRARVLVGTHESERIESLERMDEERARLSSKAEELEDIRRANTAHQAKLEARETRLEERAAQQIDDSAQAAVQRVRDLENEVVNLIARLQADPTLKNAGQTLKAIREAKKSIAPPPPSEPIIDLGKVGPGDMVYHRILRSQAQVLSEPKDGRVEAQVGSIQIMANLEDLQPSQKTAPSKPSKPQFGGNEPTSLEGVRTPSNTLDLRGMRVDEAIEETDRFLDKRLLEGDRSVFLLHGHGTGALKSAIRAWLGNNRTWRPLNESEGGDAFTLVTL
ncbi:MAG: Smr/MutS family protein [Myxococcota bacterium]|nr:Smr/MutS family protein [Myxococcota bacterium]